MDGVLISVSRAPLLPHADTFAISHGRASPPSPSQGLIPSPCTGCGYVPCCAVLGHAVGVVRACRVGPVACGTPAPGGEVGVRGGEEGKRCSSHFTLSFLILCHHVLQTGRGWRGQDRRGEKHNRKEIK